MSYCRWSGNSDVYMFDHVHGGIECCGCCMHPETFGSYNFDTPQKALAHLKKHIKAGHKVPRSAIKRLEREAHNSKYPKKDKKQWKCQQN